MSGVTEISEATLQSILDQEAALVQEASEAIPHSFDSCTYPRGHIRQAIYWCKTCAEPRGICSACSIACHGDHEQVELFPKRNFCCDCPTSCLNTQCTLHRTLELPNDTNQYGQNFKGDFCRCGRLYDAATEEETMVQCVACEDWFHESCLHIRERTKSALNDRDALDATPRPSEPRNGSVLHEAAAVGSSLDGTDAQDEDEEDEDEDPSHVLKASEYDSLICGACVKKSRLLTRWAGTPGVRLIVWRSDSNSEAGGKWTLLGEDAPSAGEAADVEVADAVATTSTAAAGVPPPAFVEASGSNPLKRPLSPSLTSTSSAFHAPTKRARGDTEQNQSSLASRDAESSGPSLSHPVTVCHAPQLYPEGQHAVASSSKGPFLPAPESPGRILEDGDSDADILLSDGWRERWCRCNECIIDLSQEPWLMEDIEIYEPPEDPDAHTSLEELGMRALESLPRERAIDGIRAYNSMRDELMTYLRPFANGGRVVQESDVKAFFDAKRSQLQRQK